MAHGGDIIDNQIFRFLIDILRNVIICLILGELLNMINKDIFNINWWLNALVILLYLPFAVGMAILGYYYPLAIIIYFIVWFVLHKINR